MKTITNQEVYDALTECIEKRWKLIVENGGGDDYRTPVCQLCEIWYFSNANCSGCPLQLFEKTKQPRYSGACMAKNASYKKWSEKRDKDSAECVLKVLQETRNHFFGDWK